jgi:hypothetical protein
MGDDPPADSLLPAAREALAAEVGGGATGGTPTEGALAREALLVLSQETEYAEILTALIDAPEVESFDPMLTYALTAAGLVWVLQTRIKFNQKWESGEVTFEKRALSNKHIAEFVRMILDFTRK